MDKIHIKNLELFCKHGVFPEENKLGQKFLLSMTLYTDTREAGITDDLTKSIHYGDVSQLAKTFLETHTYKLIETAAEQLAMELLTKVDRLDRVDIELKKPWAPVGLPLETVSVEISRSWHTAWIALGSNMGDKKAYLDMAVEELGNAPGCEVVQVSDYIATAPYGVTDQDEFLNGALVLRTLYTPEELLRKLHAIEAQADRVRMLRWGPRTLDLDILFYDDLVLDTPKLHIPHIDMQRRSFVLVPLAQLSPYKRHPVLNKTVEELKGELHD
ncbi:MAG: 2-amino-4-hydroxy-6-hydroxymethyldihydropteridine diphosphokinase [Eubacteriales bacterium]|nr:2-amino-4-hydroxy-6-hydroxymethyldihydropteridine diphosphokinase [Eubacteriales bacterium]